MSDYSSMATLQNNSQTPGYATAVQRAREVAAKIGSSKRPLEDGPEPTPKKLAPVEPVFTPQPPVMNFVDSVSPPGPVPGGRMIAGAGPGSGPTNLLPDQSINEYIRVPDRMVGLIIGRGGEQITRLQAESGCKIQMAPPSDGNPDRLCTLTGTRDAIQRAKELVNQIVNHRGRENAPQHQDQESGMNMGRPGGPNMMEEIMIPGAKVGLIIGKNGKTIKQLQEQTGAKMVVIQDGPNETAIREKPLRISGDPAKVEHAKQLVFELLANKDMQEPPRSYDDGYGGSDPGNGHATTSAEVLVPKVAIGVVIGHKGKMIKKIQADSGCRVQFNQEHDEEPGDKLCYLQGKPHQLDQARQMIEDLISSVKRCEEESRTRPVRGAGPQNGDRGMEYGQQWPDRPEVRCTFTIHGPKCGLVIGRGGEIIKQINAQSGAHCELDRRCQNNDRNTRTFVIRGHPEAVEACKRIVMEKVGGPINFIPEGNGNGNGNGNGGDGSGGGTPGPEYYGGGGGGGGAPAAWGYNPHWHQQNPSQGGPQQQVSVNPATGQLDYSQQWIDYYRSVGLVREAEAIEQAKIQQQQQQQQQQQDETSNQSLGGNDSGGPSTPQPSQDYSVQWAEYYRSIGKVKEAEAIEAQIKIKQQQQQPPPQPPQSMPPSDMGGDEATPPSQYAQYNMYQGGMYPGYGQYGYPAGNEHQ